MNAPITIEDKTYVYWKTEGDFDYYICYENGDILLLPNTIKTTGNS